MRARFMLALFLPGVAWAWPAPDAWLPLTRGGQPVDDVSGDVAPAHLDLVGAGGDAAGAWSADDDALYVRLRLAATPVDGPVLRGDTWGVLWDLDSDEVVDLVLVAQGSAGNVVLYANTQLQPGIDGAGGWSLRHAGGNYLQGDVAVVDAGGGAWWLDLRLARTAIAGIGLGADAPLRMTPATWSGVLLDGVADVAACDGQAGPCATLSAVSPDPARIDEDLDGLTLPEELLGFTDPTDADHDDDGVIDGVDPSPHACDADHDGVIDPVELGLLAPGSPDTAPDGCFAADADPLTTTDPRDADSDGGGMVDGAEDVDGDGVVGLWEGDPNDPSDDLDSDGDGLPDVIEGREDPDGDGVPAFLDDDSDGDGLRDAREGRLDPDGDGVPPWLDTDSDGDGLSDGLEGDSDPDRDGLPAHLDLDSDGDGLPDSVEGADDLDGDERPNHLDTNADGDGRSDAVEGTDDDDCDGVMDFLDPVNDDGFCDTDLPVGVVDTDAFDDPREGAGPPEGTRWTGGGCAVAPRAAGWWGLLGLLAWRRRRGAVAAAALVAGAAAVDDARAAEIDAARLRPSVDGWRYLTVEDALLARPGSFNAALLVDHAEHVLQLRQGDTRRDVLGAMTTASLLVSVTPNRFFRLGMELPLHLAVRGDAGAAGAWEQPVSTGDVRFSAKVRVADDPGGAPVQLALVGDLTLPSGQGDAYVGERTATGQLLAALRVDGGRVFSFAAEVGARSGTGERLGDLVLGPALVVGAGVSVSPVEPLMLGVELDGDVRVQRGQPGAAPLELLGTVRARVGGDVLLSFAGGGGVTAGMGAPGWRAVVGLGYMPGWSLRTAPAPVTEVVVPPCSLDVHVMGPATEHIVGATVDVLEHDALGVTNDLGLYQTRLDPGRYLVQVSFPGRVPAFRELDLTGHCQAFVEVVLVDEHVEVLGSPVE